MKYSGCIVLLSVSMVYSHDVPPCVVHFHMTNEVCALAQQKQATCSVQTINPSSDVFHRSMSAIARHQQKISTLSVLSGVSALYYRIYCYREKISSLIWGQWKAHLALHNLVQAPHNELIKELLLDIQRMYINPGNPTDALYPITTFTQVLHVESQALINYLWWHRWCTRLYIARWLPFDQKLLEQVPEQLQRIEFIQTMFRKWVAQQNFFSLTHGHDVV